MTSILDDINSSLQLLQNTSRMILDAVLKTVFLVSYRPLKAKGRNYKGSTWDFEIKTKHGNGLKYSFSSSRVSTL